MSAESPFDGGRVTNNLHGRGSPFTGLQACVAACCVLSLMYCTIIYTGVSRPNRADFSAIPAHVLHPGLFGLTSRDIPCADARTELQLSGVTAHNGHYEYLLTTPQGIIRTDEDPVLIAHLPVMDREFDSITLNRAGSWVRLCLHQASARKKEAPISLASSMIDTPLFVLRPEFQTKEKRWFYRIEKCRQYCLIMARVGITNGDTITAIDDRSVTPDALSGLIQRLSQAGWTTHTVSLLHRGATRRVTLPAGMGVADLGEHK